MSEEIEELECDDSLTSDNSVIYPNATVKIAKEQYSIFEFKRKYEQKRDIILNPDFQRGSVWNSSKQKPELIESILMGIPLPVIYLFETKEGKKEVVDGRQRITTLIEFINNKFPLENLKMLHTLNGDTFEMLDPLLQAKIEDYQLNIYVIQPPTPERVKFDIFDRVNRGGTQLNNQEMRNALYSGHSTKLLAELSELKEFKDATNGSISSKRMKDKYIILRFIGFYLLQTSKIDIEYKSDIDEFLADVMKYLNNFENYSEIIYLKDIFVKSMSLSNKLFNGDGFRFEPYEQNRRPINTPLFEVLAYLYTIVDKNSNLKSLKEEVISLKAEFDSGTYFKRSVESSKSMNYRFNEVKKLGKKYAK